MNRKQFGLILILLGGLLFLGQTQVPARIQLTGTSVVINEIHYNPDNVQGFDSRYEFAELYNNGSTAIDLSDWEFGEALTDVDNVDIPAGTMIAAGGYIIIAYTPATYNTTLNCPVVGHPDCALVGL
ncbi:MAG: lamin tail domain-containing protein [Candidatus Heimdallarchaeota archaeon]|nr:lamin tail domain-containing protein [Candidatus Heimdallarchaeota archaeon]